MQKVQILATNVSETDILIQYLYFFNSNNNNDNNSNNNKNNYKIYNESQNYLQYLFANRKKITKYTQNEHEVKRRGAHMTRYFILT